MPSALTDFIFGNSGNVTSSVRQFKPFGANTPGTSFTADNGSFTATRSPETQNALTNLSKAFGNTATDFGKLRTQVAPGFGKLTEVGLRAVEDARLRTVGDLKQNLSRRRVLGSSFAEDDISRTNAEFSRVSEQIETENFIKEIEETRQLINDESAAATAQYKVLIDQGNFESSVAAQLAASATSVLGDLAKFEAALLNEFAGRQGDIAGTVAGGLFKLFSGSGSAGTLLDKGKGVLSNVFNGGGAATSTSGLSVGSVVGGSTVSAVTPLAGGASSILLADGTTFIQGADGLVAALGGPGASSGAASGAASGGIPAAGAVAKPFGSGLPGAVVGFLAADKFTVNENSASSRIGAKVVGTIAGKIGGPIAGGAGALFGGILGNMFGAITGIGDEDRPDFDILTQGGNQGFRSGDFITSAFGNIGFNAANTRNLGGAEGKKILSGFQPIVDMDNDLASVMTQAEVAAVKSKLQGAQIGNAHDEIDPTAALMRQHLSAARSALTPERAEATGLTGFIDKFNSDIDDRISAQKDKNQDSLANAFADSSFILPRQKQQHLSVGLNKLKRLKV